MAIDETKNTNVATAFTSGVIPRRIIPYISIGNVFSLEIKKKVTGISSIESTKDNKTAPIMAVFILGKITLKKACNGLAPKSKAAISKYGSNFLKRAKICVIIIAIKKVVCPIKTAVNDNGIPNIGKKLNIATPVTIPGNVMGNNITFNNKLFPK